MTLAQGKSARHDGCMDNMEELKQIYPKGTEKNNNIWNCITLQIIIALLQDVLCIGFNL